MYLVMKSDREEMIPEQTARKYNSHNELSLVAERYKDKMHIYETIMESSLIHECEVLLQVNGISYGK